jgi:plasmid maintenance system antidote protein VapI
VTLPARLPAGPLVAVVEAHFAARSHMTRDEHAVSIGLTGRRVWGNIKVQETVTLGMADRICSGMGTGLDEVYGPGWDLEEAS